MSTPTPRQAQSKRFFNSLHRIDVALAVRGWTTSAGTDEGTEMLDHDAIVAASGAPRSATHTELQALVDIGAVNRIVPERRVYYVAEELHPFWAFVADLARRSEADAAGVRHVTEASSRSRTPEGNHAPG